MHTFYKTDKSNTHQEIYLSTVSEPSEMKQNLVDSGYVQIDTSTSTSPESGFQFTARTSFTHTSERSWSIVQGQLNACLPTISRKIESRKCFAKK